jgi:hypothetical protein
VQGDHQGLGGARRRPGRPTSSPRRERSSGCRTPAGRRCARWTNSNTRPPTASCGLATACSC